MFLGDHRLVIEEIRQATTAPIVLGGAGFSSMPFAAMEYFNVPFGVKGPGELILCALAHALAGGRSPDTVTDLLLYDGESVRVATGAGAPVARATLRRTTDRLVGDAAALRAPVAGATLGHLVEARYTRRSNVPYRVNNRAYYDRGGLGNLLTKNGCSLTCNHCLEPDAKGDVIARRAVSAVVDEMESLVSQGIFDLHTTDSGFNLAFAHSKALLREIIARRRGGASPRVDLRLWIYAHPLPFDEEMADLLAEAGCKGASMTEYERQFWFDEQGRDRPVFYFSPDLPEDPGVRLLCCRVARHFLRGRRGGPHPPTPSPAGDPAGEGEHTTLPSHATLATLPSRASCDAPIPRVSAPPSPAGSAAGEGVWGMRATTAASQEVACDTTAEEPHPRPGDPRATRRSVGEDDPMDSRVRARVRARPGGPAHRGGRRPG